MAPVTRITAMEELAVFGTTPAVSTAGIVGHSLRLIAGVPTQKLENEANRIRFERK